jgi:hypothetical protein
MSARQSVVGALVVRMPADLAFMTNLPKAVVTALSFNGWASGWAAHRCDACPLRRQSTSMREKASSSDARRCGRFATKSMYTGCSKPALSGRFA